MENLVTVVADLGFPIVVTIYLLIRMERKMDTLGEAINRLSNTILINESIKHKDDERVA